MHTIYFGGGTPSLLTPVQLARIIDVIRSNYNLSEIKEVTIEANPENLTPKYLFELAGLNFFNRISIGVQSFSDKMLRMLNRVHSSEQAFLAVKDAAEAGFDNISVDLMMGLPGQHYADIEHSLDSIESLNGLVKHLSFYEYTVEPRTILEQQLKMKRCFMPDEDELASQYDLMIRWCKDHGFEQYEVSNFCRSGYRSLHNSRYWNLTPYIGIGAAAHSYDGISRRWNVADVTRYVEGAKEGMIPFEKELLSHEDSFNEYMMVALRTKDGVSKKMLSERFCDYEEYFERAIKPFQKAELIEETPDSYRPTPKGLLHADGIAQKLFL